MPSPSKPHAPIVYRLLFRLLVLSIPIYLIVVSCIVLFLVFRSCRCPHFRCISMIHLLTFVSNPFLSNTSRAIRSTRLFSTKSLCTSTTTSPTKKHTMSVAVVRDVAKVVVAREQSEGVGARVRRSIGRPELQNFDPFLMLDEFHVHKPAGFPE